MQETIQDTSQDIQADELDYIPMDHCPDIWADNGQVIISDPDGLTEHFIISIEV